MVQVAHERSSAELRAVAAEVAGNCLPNVLVSTHTFLIKTKSGLCLYEMQSTWRCLPPISSWHQTHFCCTHPSHGILHAIATSCNATVEGSVSCPSSAVLQAVRAHI